MKARTPIGKPDAPTQVRERCYLYGVMFAGSDCDDTLPDRGIIDRPIALVRRDELAAIFSPLEESDLISRRGASLIRNLRAHTATLTRIAENHTILPAGFGVQLKREELQGWLRDDYDRLRAELLRLEGGVELKVRAAYTEEGMVDWILKENPALVKSLRASRGTKNRIAFGKAMANAVQHRTEEEGREIRARLAAVAENSVTHPPGERDLVSVSLLVARGEIETVDRILRAIDSERGDVLELSCIGPLPPYSFVAPLMERKAYSYGIA